MKKIALIILSVCSIFLYTNGQVGKANKQPLVAYTNTEHHVKLQYPKTWELTDTITGAVFYIFTPSDDNDQFRENINFTFEDISQTATTFKEYVDLNLTGMKDGSTILDFKQTSERYFMWNGKQAYEIIYTGRVQDVDFPLTWCQRFIFNNGKAYILTYSAEGGKKDPFIADAKIMMNSLKFY